MKKEKKRNSGKKALVMLGGTLLSLAGILLIPVLNEKFGAKQDQDEEMPEKDEIEFDDEVEI